MEGLDFHKYYFELSQVYVEGYAADDLTVRARSTMVDPRVTISNNLGVVTYTRLVQAPGSGFEGNVHAVNETRVWERRKISPGVWEWKHIHVHRSYAPNAVSGYDL